MMRRILLLVGTSAILACAGCGDPKTEHVWKDQTDLIDKSRGVEDLLLDTSRQQRRDIDEMAQ
jgi:hypothetical protein